MAKSPPELIDPLRLADQELELNGSYPLAALERLAPMLAHSTGEVSFILRFFCNSDGQRVVQGTVHARLHLTCQRCLQLMEFPVNQEVLLGIVQTLRAADQLGAEFDPLLVEGLVSLREMVEDELLLALPLVASHELNACPARGVVELNHPASLNPFENLKL